MIGPDTSIGDGASLSAKLSSDWNNTPQGFQMDKRKLVLKSSNIHFRKNKNKRVYMYTVCMGEA